MPSDLWTLAMYVVHTSIEQAKYMHKNKKIFLKVLKKKTFVYVYILESFYSIRFVYYPSNAPYY